MCKTVAPLISTKIWQRRRKQFYFAKNLKCVMIQCNSKTVRLNWEKKQVLASWSPHETPSIENKKNLSCRRRARCLGENWIGQDDKLWEKPIKLKGFTLGWNDLLTSRSNQIKFLLCSLRRLPFRTQRENKTKKNVFLSIIHFSIL